MKNKKIIEWLKELPEDYDITLSGFSVYVQDEDYFVFVDNPITGLMKSDDTNEVRFIVNIKDREALKRAYPEYREITDED